MLNFGSVPDQCKTYIYFCSTYFTFALMSSVLLDCAHLVLKTQVLRLQTCLFRTNYKYIRKPNFLLTVSYELRNELSSKTKLTMCAMMLSLCKEGCRLKRTMSPSIRCLSTTSPNLSSWAIFSRFPYFKNLTEKDDSFLVVNRFR